MRRLRTAGPELLVVAGGLAYAVLGRGRWANMETDHGFWFSAAQSMLAGGRAMHEVRLQYGPVSLWILEWICRIFGTRVSAVVAFQFVIGLAGIAGVQALSQRFLSRAEQWISAAILVPLIVWMVGPGNLLYPCAFPMSHALFLAVAALFLCAALLARVPAAAPIAAGVVAGVTLLTKQEFGAAAFLGIAAMILSSRTSSGIRKVAGIALAAAAMGITYFTILFFARRGDSFSHLVRENLLWPWVPVPPTWRHLFTRYMGLDRPADRLREMFDSFVDLAAFGGTAWASLYGRRRRWKALAATLAAVWLLWAWRWTEGSHFLPMTLTLPAIVCSTIVVFCHRQKVKPHPGRPEAGHPSPRGEGWVLQEDSPSPPGEGAAGVGFHDGAGLFLALAIGALVLLQREGYRGSIEGYYSGMGYVLAIPVVAPLVWRLIRGPAEAGRRTAVAVGVAAGLLSVFGAGRLTALVREWKAAVPLATPRGTVYSSAGFAPALADTARFLETHSRPGDAILVLPSTLGLDFALDRTNLSFFPYVVPGYLTPEGEAELIARCERTPPRAAVVFGRSVGILRSGDLGRGFADSLIEWVRRRLPNREDFSYPGGPAGVRYWGS